MQHERAVVDHVDEIVEYVALIGVEGLVLLGYLAKVKVVFAV